MSAASRESAQLDRLTFFSDAVFAIAITLLVIEIRMPHVRIDGEISLINALLSLIPQYIGFVVSFFVIGRFWLGHHRAFGHLARTDETLIWRNLVFLLTIAFMPFPTAVISEYATLRTTIVVYAGWLILAGFLNRRVIAYAVGRPELLADDADPDARERCARAAWSPMVIGALALLFGMVMPLLALVPLMGSPLILWAMEKFYVARPAIST